MCAVNSERSVSFLRKNTMAKAMPKNKNVKKNIFAENRKGFCVMRSWDRNQKSL
jgi:hypothetical protein